MRKFIMNNFIKSRCRQSLSSVVAIVAIVAAQSNDSLTIARAVEAVLHNSHALKELSLQIEAASSRTAESKTAYYPTVSADLTYANIGPADNLAITGFGPKPLDMAPANSFDAHLGANIELYDFGKTGFSVKAADFSKKTLNDKTAGIGSFLTFQAISLVANIAMIQQGIAIQNENIESLDRHYGVVKKRVETGSQTDYDLLKTQAQLASARHPFLI